MYEAGRNKDLILSVQACLTILCCLGKKYIGFLIETTSKIFQDKNSSVIYAWQI